MQHHGLLTPARFSACRPHCVCCDWTEVSLKPHLLLRSIPPQDVYQMTQSLVPQFCQFSAKSRGSLGAYSVSACRSVFTKHLFSHGLTAMWRTYLVCRIFNFQGSFEGCLFVPSLYSQREQPKLRTSQKIFLIFF